MNEDFLLVGAKSSAMAVVVPFRPRVLTHSPVDGSYPYINENIVITFSHSSMAAGTGQVMLKDRDSFKNMTIPVPDAQVTVSGTAVTINPKLYLKAATNYTVIIPGTSFTDSSSPVPRDMFGLEYKWNFTSTLDAIPPTLIETNFNSTVTQTQTLTLTLTDLRKTRSASDSVFIINYYYIIYIYIYI